jgi:hypothetical protein
MKNPVWASHSNLHNSKCCALGWAHLFAPVKGESWKWVAEDI